MPIYEYECSACGHRFEAVQKMSEDPISVCPSCNDAKQVRRLVSATSFHLKGSGWYKTDYGSSGSGGSSGSTSASDSSEGSSTDSGSKESSSSSTSSKAESSKSESSTSASVKSESSSTTSKSD